MTKLTMELDYFDFEYDGQVGDKADELDMAPGKEVEFKGFDRADPDVCVPCLSIDLTLDSKDHRGRRSFLSVHIDGYQKLMALRTHIDLVLELAEKDRLA